MTENRITSSGELSVMRVRDAFKAMVEQCVCSGSNRDPGLRQYCDSWWSRLRTLIVFLDSPASTVPGTETCRSFSQQTDKLCASQ